MRSMVFSNTAKPLRPVCPRCEKKGISVWHTLETFRSRDCRYCGYTEFQTYVMEGWNFDGVWTKTEADRDRMNSHNGVK